jgi:hypothetical protein
MLLQPYRLTFLAKAALADKAAFSLADASRIAAGRCALR